MNLKHLSYIKTLTMKYALYILLLSFVIFQSFISESYSQTIDKIFLEMPNDLYSSMSNQSKVELIEYHKARLSDTIENRMKNKVFVIRLDTLHQILKIQTTPVSILELKMCKINGQIVVAMIRTVCAPVCSSTLDFFDSRWKRTDTGFQLPHQHLWLKTCTADSLQINQSLFQTNFISNFVSFTFGDQDSLEVIVSNNILAYLNEEDCLRFKSCLNLDELRLVYNSTGWNYEKRP